MNKIMDIHGAFNKFPDFFVQAFKIIFNNWNQLNEKILIMSAILEAIKMCNQISPGSRNIN